MFGVWHVHNSFTSPSIPPIHAPSLLRSIPHVLPQAPAFQMPTPPTPEAEALDWELTSLVNLQQPHGAVEYNNACLHAHGGEAGSLAASGDREGEEHAGSASGTGKGHAALPAGLQGLTLEEAMAIHRAVVSSVGQCGGALSGGPDHGAGPAGGDGAAQASDPGSGG